MKVTNAIKKLEKAGFKVTNDDGNFSAKKGNEFIEFFQNGGGSEEVVCIRVRSANDHDDCMRDYCAGVFCNNITQAIRLAH